MSATEEQRTASNRRRKRCPAGRALASHEVSPFLQQGNHDASHDDNGREETASQTAEDIFVGTCFFARLGFLQPPSCVRCAHHAAMKGSAASKEECHDLVAWRIDAKTELHPEELDGNVVFLALVDGKMCPSVRWDARKKRLWTSE